MNIFLFITLSLLPFSITPGLINVPYLIEEVYPIYVDEELESLWSSLDELYQPTAQDYLKIEEYLKYGRRPYLDTLYNHGIQIGWITPSTHDRSIEWSSRVLQRIKLVGTDLQMPYQNKFVIGDVSPNDLSRCILLYTSFNADTYDHKTPYSERALQIIADLESEGYQGHVLLRTGGYPMIEKGGVRFIHIPYSFKLLSIIEASLMGYSDVLWLDCSAHPANDLSSVFSYLHKNGVFLLTNGINLDYDYNYKILPDKAVESCDLTPETLKSIPHIPATIIGVSFKDHLQHDFLKEWYRLTALTTPAMTLYPEEFLLSIAAWRTNKPICGHWGNFVNVRSQIPNKPTNSAKPFWFDKS